MSAWLPVVAYVAVIFTWSSFTLLSPPGDVNHLDKAAHVVEYGILGWLLARALAATVRHRALVFLLAVFLGAGIGALDETYQEETGRERSLGDWIADTSSVVVFSGATLWFPVRRTREGAS